MKSLLLLAALSFIAPALSGCASLSDDDNEEKRLRTAKRELQEEIAVGREMAARLFGRFGRPAGSGIALRYVNLVGASIAARWGRPDLTFHFAILDTDIANAMATPGGYIFITRGLLQRMRNESELATVLAHEIAHVNEKHMYREIAPKSETTGAGIFSLISRGGGTLGKSITKIAEKGLEILLKNGFGKEKELEADQAGMVYAESAGYNPSALPAIVQRLPGERYGNERIDAMKQAIRALGGPTREIATARVLVKRFHQAVHTFQIADSEKTP